ncbi:MAG: alkaline phosphatase family protein, partial [Salinisphaera sp.]|uniref:alkaline phosphatase family protein n=1 Tax=Salinisphaera sp. TaxID=1914330 RepID=UPI003C7D57CE
AADGALFQRAYGVTHPSEPNYLALFSGSLQGVRSDSCPHHFTDGNLASELDAAGLSFAVYSQGLPHAGYQGCRLGEYARKHNPAVNWQGVNLAPSQNLPFTAFPKQFGNLPTVSFVIPDIDHDMHSASIRAGDHWLQKHLQRYGHWALGTGHWALGTGHSSTIAC